MRIGPPLLAVSVVCAGLFTLFVPTWNLPVPGRQTGPNGPSLVQWAPTGSPLFQTVNGPPPADPGVLRCPSTTNARAGSTSLITTVAKSQSARVTCGSTKVPPATNVT